MTEAQLDSHIQNPASPFHAMALYRRTEQNREALLAEQKRLSAAVDSLTEGQSHLNRSVERLHRIDVWILIAGAVAALAGVILLVLEWLHASGASK